MLFEIKNALLREVTDVTSGTNRAGDEWTRATVILEKVEGNYTDTYPMTAFGERIGDAQGLVGETVDVKFNVQAREYNGRWYIDLGLRFITIHETERPATPPVPAPAPAPLKDDDDDPNGGLPF